MPLVDLCLGSQQRGSWSQLRARSYGRRRGHFNARAREERGSEVSTPSMVSRPSSRRRAPSLALLTLLALLATAVNRVGASEETLVAVPLVVSGAAGPDPDPVSCAAEFFPADFDRDGTLAPCFRVASMRDDDVDDGEEEEAQLCDACVTAVGDVLLPRMLAAGMDPTIADAVAACLYAALPAATDAGVPVFAVVDRCDLLSLGAAGALARNTPEVEKATASTAFEPTEPTDEPTELLEPIELTEPTRPKPEPRPRDPRYPDTGLTAAADAAEAIDGDEERSKRATLGATTAVFAAADDEKGEPPPSPSPSPKRRRGLSDGAIVSIVIVCVAGSALPISLLVACVHARRRRREEKLLQDLEGAG